MKKMEDVFDKYKLSKDATANWSTYSQDMDGDAEEYVHVVDIVDGHHGQYSFGIACKIMGVEDESAEDSLEAFSEWADALCEYMEDDSYDIVWYNDGSISVVYNPTKREEFMMLCDSCGEHFKYSEETIHHWTVLIDGKLRPHTHICIKCEEMLGLVPKEISNITKGENVGNEYKFAQVSVSMEELDSTSELASATVGENSTYIDLDDFIDFGESNDTVAQYVVKYPDSKLLEFYVAG